MKKLLFILSALLIITGCSVESASNVNPNPSVEEDEYSDGIYLFYASIDNNNIKEITIEYCYRGDSSYEKNTYYINRKESKVSEIFKVDINKLKYIRLRFKKYNNEEGQCGYDNLDKSSFENLENGLYVAEYFGHCYRNYPDGLSETFLRKTKSVDYYLNYENFYDNKSFIFIKNDYPKEAYTKIKRQKFVQSSNLYGHYIKHNDIRGFVIYDPPKTEGVDYWTGTRRPLDYSTIIHGDSSIDVTQLGKGYFYTEIDSEGKFTTPVKLNSYKDILDN